MDIKYKGRLSDACYKSFMDGYEPPTPLEIKQFMNHHNLTAGQVANICGMAGDRSVRKWTSPKEFKNEAGEIRKAKNASTIPYACWRLLLLHVGEISINGIRENKNKMLTMEALADMPELQAYVRDLLRCDI